MFSKRNRKHVHEKYSIYKAKKLKKMKMYANTLKDLKSFQDFLTRNFKSSLPLNKVKPTSNQPAFLYGTAKTHKFQNSEQITKDNLKLRPIVSTCGTFYYETAKFLVSYLLPLTENEYSIKTTTDFAEHLSNRTVDDNEVLVSYDVSSLFTEVPLDETIDYIIHEIYTNNKLPQLSSKLLFRRLLCNVTKNTVLMASYINKSMDAAWATHYLQSLQTFSWLN